MSTEKITARILADAEAEAGEIVADANAKAAALEAEAAARVEALRKETELETAEKRKSILEKREADARLDSAKLLLGKKRRVVDTVYDEAHSRLLELPKEQALQLCARLLKEYAEDGDEIVFAKSFAYAKEAALLPVVKEKKLRVAAEKEEFSGGLRLVGKVSDKDLSFGALLKADRDEHQAALAREIFK